MGEKALYTAVIYLGCLIAAFSLIRRYKAGVIWENSLIRKLGVRLSIFLQDRPCRTADRILHRLPDLQYDSSPDCTYLYLKWHILSMTLKIMIGVLAALWFCLNLWIFYVMFRRAADRDKIDLAIRHLADGETSYQVDLTQFPENQRDCGNLNNASRGLEMALSEKVKSERLKAI